jgi:hypothetical protein
MIEGALSGIGPSPNKSVALDRASITVLRDMTFLAADPASERSRLAAQTMTMADDFREWQPSEWFDRGFLESVPAPAQQDFLDAFRPLSADSSQRVTVSLFAGVRQPFHYVRATGWMARLLRTEAALPDTASFEQREACLRAKLAWLSADIVLLVYQQPTVYAARWASFLRNFRRGWLNLDTLLVCHPTARDVVLFWEEHGPAFGKRGPRELPCPTWGNPSPTEE